MFSPKSWLNYENCWCKYSFQNNVYGPLIAPSNTNLVISYFITTYAIFLSKNNMQINFCPSINTFFIVNQSCVSFNWHWGEILCTCCMHLKIFYIIYFSFNWHSPDPVYVLNSPFLRIKYEWDMHIMRLFHRSSIMD